jgi:hypothetical protein
VSIHRDRYKRHCLLVLSSRLQRIEYRICVFNGEQRDYKGQVHRNEGRFNNVVFSKSTLPVTFSSRCPEASQTKCLRPLMPDRRKSVAFWIKEVLKRRLFSTAPCQRLVPSRSPETYRRKGGRPRRPEAAPSGRRPLTDTYSLRSRRGKKHVYVRFCLYCLLCDNNIRYVILNLRILTSSEKVRAHIELQAYQNMSTSMLISP